MDGSRSTHAARVLLQYSLTIIQPTNFANFLFSKIVKCSVGRLIDWGRLHAMAEAETSSIKQLDWIHTYLHIYKFGFALDINQSLVKVVT